jgi:hypothetical protein
MDVTSQQQPETDDSVWSAVVVADAVSEIDDAPPLHGVSAPLPWSVDLEQPAVRWREWLAIVLLVVLCDVTIYRGQGFAGLALLFAAAPVLLVAGSPWARRGVSLGLAGVMLAILAAKMLWCGSSLLAAIGVALLMAFAMCLAGLPPYVVELTVFATLTVVAGYHGLIHHGRCLAKTSPLVARANWLNVTLPLMAFLIFSMLFILANPDLVAWFSQGLSDLIERLREGLFRYAPRPLEIIFWTVVLWIVVGLLRPVLNQTPSMAVKSAANGKAPSHKSAPDPLYPALRNTLLTVIGLFAVYLAFEFQSMWFRVFPKGFYYSGYAHEGAAWLTVALALATAMLSVVFRGGVLHDPRLPRLRKLAWLWSLENMLLAVAVYHRLFIYVGFNGMTRMRVVALFGMSAVVAGFLLVLWKIARNRDFVWLIRHQLWALGITVYLFALTPVDTIVVSYNVQRILSGDPAPSVQISVHPISAEGVLLLRPLLDCDDETICEGVRAMLAKRHEQAESLAQSNQQLGWTTYQVSDQLVLRKLRASQKHWGGYSQPDERDAVLRRFHDYAYQWY